jgi:hypothetical protein
MFNATEHTIQLLQPGKQGIVGLVDDDRVFKYSVHFGYLGTHEDTVLQSLAVMHSYCPYFLRRGRLAYMNVSLDCSAMLLSEDREGDAAEYLRDMCPFVNPQQQLAAAAGPGAAGPGGALVDVVFAEYVSGARKLVQFNRHTSVPDHVLASQVLQVLAGIMLAQDACKLTHYDLHSENIMVQRCAAPSDVFVFTPPPPSSSAGKAGTAGTSAYLLPTYGYFPRIIDYGFSYTADVQRLTSPLGFMANGYLTHRFDAYADFRVLLVSFLDDCIRHRPASQLTDRLYKLLSGDIYRDSNIDWESGWILDTHKKGACEYIHKKFHGITDQSVLFSEYDMYIYDTLQSLISLPLTDPYAGEEKARIDEDMATGLATFVGEFVMLEQELPDIPMTRGAAGLYLVRCLASAAEFVKDKYYTTGGSGDIARTFEGKFFDLSRGIFPFSHCTAVDYAKLMTSLFVVVECLQSLLYRESRYRSKVVDRENARVNRAPGELFEEVYRTLMPPLEAVTIGTRFLYMNDKEKCMTVYTVKTQDDVEAFQRAAAAGSQAQLVMGWLHGCARGEPAGGGRSRRAAAAARAAARATATAKATATSVVYSYTCEGQKVVDSDASDWTTDASDDDSTYSRSTSSLDSRYTWTGSPPPTPPHQPPHQPELAGSAGVKDAKDEMRDGAEEPKT